MVDLPEPLTPEGCDLRDFPYMPLLVSRLRRSKAWLIAKRSPELGFYMVNLWSGSWHEVPSGSLEDDDDVLADVAMCVPNKWKKLREAALHGWVKCQDGRLYHPVVCEQAIEAWDRKTKRKEAGRRGNAIRWGPQPVSQSDPIAIAEPSPSLARDLKGREEKGIAGQPVQIQTSRDPPKRVNGHGRGTKHMPTLNSDWSAWEWLTDGEVEICGPNAQRRPCVGDSYLDAVARDVSDAAGIDGHAGGIDWSPIAGWLKEGIPGHVIVSAIKRVASRDDYEPKINLKYFNRPVHEEAGKP